MYVDLHMKKHFLSIHFSPLISYLSEAADLSASPLRPQSASVDARTEISSSSISDLFKTCRTETASSVATIQHINFAIW